MPPNQALSQLQLYHFQDDNMPEILLKVTIWMCVATYSIETITDMMCTFVFFLFKMSCFIANRNQG